MNEMESVLSKKVLRVGIYLRLSNEDRDKVNIDVGKYKGTFFGNYLESVNYADYAFGKFIEEHNIHTNGGVALYEVDYSLSITKNDRKIIDKHHELLPILAKKWGIENNIVEVI